MPALTVSQIRKSFPAGAGRREVLHDVSFQVPEGRVVCLLGPNGSGKTTLLKTISTLLAPEGGRVLLGGLDAHGDPREAKRLIGFVSTEDQSFYGRLSARLNLWFYAQMHGVSAAAFDDRLRGLSDQLELGGVLDRPFRELSSGQKQRMLLARALLHDPAVLLLDEPHQNLDPFSSIRLRELVRDEWGKRQGKTILVSTHHLEDAEKMSPDWVILSGGRVRYQGSLESEKRAAPDFDLEAFFRRAVSK